MTRPDDYINQIICGDALTILKEMPGGVRPDVLLADPPWGLENSSGTINDARAKSRYSGNYFTDDEDNIISVCVPVIKMLLKICARGAVTPGNKYYYHYPAPKTLGAFYQPAAVGLTHWGYVNLNPIYFYGRDPRVGKTISQTVYKLTEKPDNFRHPCPKPLKAWMWLLEKISLPGELVIDPFCGVGTTAMACKILKRNYICIDINPAYIEIARQRLVQELIFK